MYFSFSFWLIFPHSLCNYKYWWKSCLPHPPVKKSLLFHFSLYSPEQSYWLYEEDKMEEQHDELQYLSCFTYLYYTYFFKGMCHSRAGAVCPTKIKALSHGENLFWQFIYCLSSFFSQYHSEMIYFQNFCSWYGKGGRKKKVRKEKLKWDNFSHFYALPKCINK